MATKKSAAASLVRDPFVMSDAELDQIMQDADNDLDNVVFTYEDALRYLRRQQLICLGPLPTEHAEHAAKLFKQGRTDAAISVRRLNRGVRNRSTLELEPCGYNYVTMIEATQHPLDGSIMTYQCPKCGVQGEMRVMRLNVSDAPPRDEHERLHKHFLRDAREAATKRAQRDAQQAKRR